MKDIETVCLKSLLHFIPCFLKILQGPYQKECDGFKNHKRISWRPGDYIGL